MIKEVFRAGALIMNNRNRYDVLAKVVEEVGELSQEVAIAQGASYKERGSDGVMGEGVDVIICILDLIRLDNPRITESEILDLLNAKLVKWKKAEFEYGIAAKARWQKVQGPIAIGSTYSVTESSQAVLDKIAELRAIEAAAKKVWLAHNKRMQYRYARIKTKNG